MTEEIIEVEVAYATPEAQCILKVRGNPGMTVLEAAPSAEDTS